jgi:hypothetical protein
MKMNNSYDIIKRRTTLLLGLKIKKLKEIEAKQLNNNYHRTSNKKLRKSYIIKTLSIKVNKEKDMKAYNCFL